MSDRVAIAPIRRHGVGAPHADQDLVAVESPLSVVVRSARDNARERALGLLMRTPGDDEDLVRGMLFSEAILRSASDIVAIRLTAHGLRLMADGLRLTEKRAMRDETDVADVTLAESIDLDLLFAARAQMPTSACGLCGRLEMTATDRRGEVPANLTFSSEMISRLPAALRNGQTVFAETGGLHAAALCDAQGRVQMLREDIGRHNAVDKVVGAALAAGLLPATRGLLAVSGRVAYEIVHKAALAGVAAIVAVGAPSHLAVEAAKAAGITLVGFAREGRFNVYAGFDRIEPPF